MDDAAEWGQEEFLDTLGDRPVTVEELVEWLVDHPINTKEVYVEDLLRKMRKARA